MKPNNEYNFEKQSDLKDAISILLEITSLLEQSKIEYTLEGGTLLGLVRDNNILPWDHDLDLSIKQTQLHHFSRLKWQFLRKGYRFSYRYSTMEHGPFKKGMVNLIKVKPLIKPFLNFFRGRKVSHFVVTDVFIKVPDDQFYYWQAKDKTMRVKKHYYEGTDHITFQNTNLKVPHDYRAYLTEKYGDWATPVKKWDCNTDEKAIWK